MALSDIWLDNPPAGRGGSDPRAAFVEPCRDAQVPQMDSLCGPAQAVVCNSLGLRARPPADAHVRT